MWKSLPCHSVCAMAWVNETAHRLVSKLGIQADHLGPFELIDERERVSDGWQEHVAPWLVRLRLEGEPTS